MKCQQDSAIKTLDLLVVDADASTAGVVSKGAANWGGQTTTIRSAGSVDQALSQMKLKAADVVFVSLQINDNSGLGLIKTLHEKHPRTRIIALSRAARGKGSDDHDEVFAAGAADVISGTVRTADIRRSMASLGSRQSELEKIKQRNVRLRNLCKQLNKARHEIRSQVDLLCNDLVRAYQEMAQQLNLTQVTVEYCQAAGNEIEVEGLLRKTMEWVLQKLGPINAAVYLSDAEHRFALGAYLNLDTEADADLINTIGETIIRQTDGSAHALSIDTDANVDELFGEHGQRLKGRSWLSAGCYSTQPGSKRECLAVLVLFRGQQKDAGPFDPSVRGMIEAVAPVLGEKIEQALELYHRMHPDGEDE